MRHVFISYSHLDASFREVLIKHLQILRTSGLIDSWHDGQIGPGSDWKKAIDEHINRADIIILLISADFLASQYCQEIELQRALERWEAQSVDIVPILIRACAWEASPIHHLQVLPKGALPVSQWAHQDEAWTEITRRVREIADTSKISENLTSADRVLAERGETGAAISSPQKLSYTRSTRKSLSYATRIVVGGLAVSIAMFAVWTAGTTYSARPGTTVASESDASVTDDAPATDSRAPEKLEERATVSSCPSDMALIGPGTFFMGSKLTRDEQPVHREHVHEFCLDRLAVTAERFASCVEANGCEPPPAGKNCNFHQADRMSDPINCVTFAQATAFCLRLKRRLPTEVEREFAARGVNGRTFPWGEEAPAARACWSGPGNDRVARGWTTTCPVAAYPGGSTPEGVFGLVGNIWEWTSSPYSSYKTGVSSKNEMATRGGQYGYRDSDRLRASVRAKALASQAMSDIGFRCAAETEAVSR